VLSHSLYCLSSLHLVLLSYFFALAFCSALSDRSILSDSDFLAKYRTDPSQQSDRFERDNAVDDEEPLPSANDCTTLRRVVTNVRR
jgi:hypothetical protein